MGPRSVREYAEAMRLRYQRATKGEKGRLLDEFCQVRGYHRKSAIRLLGQPRAPGSTPRRGRPRQYGLGVVLALRPSAEGLRQVWEAGDRMGSKRLALPLKGWPLSFRSWWGPWSATGRWAWSRGWGSSSSP